MANLSETTLRRQGTVRSFVNEELSSDSYNLVHKHEGSTRGLLVFKRLIMLSAQTLIPARVTDGGHILDNDDNWRIFEREMRIPSSKFYEMADMGRNGWMPFMFSHANSLDRNFHRTIIPRGGGMWTPELVEAFPEFSQLTVQPENSNFNIEEIVYRDLGKIGGSTHLSSNKKLTGVLFDVNGTTIQAQDFDPDISEHLYNFSQGDVIGITPQATDLDGYPQFDIPEPVVLGDPNEIRVIPINVYAEDGSQGIYTIILTT